MIVIEKSEEKAYIAGFACSLAYAASVYSLFCSCGGVEVYNDNGKIKVSNTLESRIELMAQQVEKLW